MDKTPAEQPSVSPEMARAEELVDSWGNALSALAGRWGHELLKSAALAREELEDIWAEAEARSREQRS